MVPISTVRTSRRRRISTAGRDEAAVTMQAFPSSIVVALLALPSGCAAPASETTKVATPEPAVSRAAPERDEKGSTGDAASEVTPDVELGQGAVRTPALVRRVGGDREIAIEVRDGVYFCAASTIEAPLPDGYPEPTPPGAIDLKEYPSVRRAEFRQESARGMNARMNVGFWPLFNHISRNEIPMTSPVEIEFDGVFDDLETLKPQPDGAWTMSFLYRSKDLGPIGDDGPVNVVDTPAITVLSVGVRGSYGMNVAREGVAALKPWLDGQREWEIAGEPRIFHYNGPSIRDENKWSEIQVPVRRRATADASAEASASPQQGDAASR